MIYIKLEVELPNSTHGSAVYQMPFCFDDGVLSLSESEQTELVINTWGKMGINGKLIAFHLPVTTWNRVAINQTEP